MDNGLLQGNREEHSRGEGSQDGNDLLGTRESGRDSRKYEGADTSGTTEESRSEQQIPDSKTRVYASRETRETTADVHGGEPDKTLDGSKRGSEELHGDPKTKDGENMEATGGNREELPEGSGTKEEHVEHTRRNGNEGVHLHLVEGGVKDNSNDTKVNINETTKENIGINSNDEREVAEEAAFLFYSRENPEILMPEEIKENVPALYSEEDIEVADKVVHAAYVMPLRSSWTWYLTEYDPKTQNAFGLVLGDFTEWGYFNVKELEELGAERLITMDFPKTFRELRDIELVNQMSEEEISKTFFGTLDKEKELEVKNIDVDFKILSEGMEVDHDGNKKIVVDFDKEDNVIWLKDMSKASTMPFMYNDKGFKDEVDILFTPKPTGRPLPVYTRHMKVEYEGKEYEIDHLFDYVSWKEMHLKDKDRNKELIYFDEENELYHRVFPIKEDIEKELLAVKVGGVFIVAPKMEFDEIKLVESGMRVNVSGTEYPLYKGRTFYESSQIDHIIDKSLRPMSILWTTKVEVIFT